MNKTIYYYFWVIILICSMVSCSASQVKQPAELKAKDNKHESRIKHDPIEDDPKYEQIFKTIDAEITEILKDDPDRDHMGFVHIFWRTKKKLLKERYGIEWKSPGVMNPQIIFD